MIVLRPSLCRSARNFDHPVPGPTAMVAVGLALAALVAVAVLVRVAVVVLVPVAVAVLVRVAVAVLVPVAVAVPGSGVCDAVEVSVTVGLLVGVPV